MKIGIFGCTADPFTEAHTAIVSKLLVDHIVDKVVIAPTIVDWHRKGKVPWLDDEQKIDIIHTRLENDIGLKTLPPLKVGYWNIWDKDFKTREICKATPALEEKYVKGHRFIDTLIDIIRSYEWNFVGDKNGNEYFVVIGSDSYWDMKQWSMWEDIVKLAKLVVVKGRDGIALPSTVDGYPPCIEMEIDSKYATTSATKERETWKEKGFEAYKQHIISTATTVEQSNGKPLLHTPIFDVVKGTKTKTGLEPVLVKAPDWVTLIVEKDGKLLVEKQYRYGSASTVEEFPCGMVEEGEDPLDAAVRELEEETGYKVLDKSQVVKLGSVNPNPAFMTNTMHYFYVDLSKAKFKKTSQKLDAHEQLQFFFKDADAFCKRAMKAASLGKHNVPAMLVGAIAMLGYSRMEDC